MPTNNAGKARSTDARPNTTAGTWMKPAATLPNTLWKAGRNPCVIPRDSVSAMSGPGVSLSAASAARKSRKSWSEGIAGYGWKSRVAGGRLPV